MARRSMRLLAPKEAPKIPTRQMVYTPTPPAPMNNIPVATRPSPPPIKPGVVTFLDLAGEIRNQIYSELLPDKMIQSADHSRKLRLDGRTTSTAFMATCHQVYEEAISILYPSTVDDTLSVKIKPSGNAVFLGRTSSLPASKPAKFSVLSRAKRFNLDIEVGRSLQFEAVCDVQDAMFNIARLLMAGHQLEGMRVSITIGADPPAHGLFGYDDVYEDDLWDMYGWGGRGRANLGRMQEFGKIKPGDISRAHIVAFLTDPLRMIRGVKQGRKYENLSLDFPGKTGRPWRDIHGQVYDLILGNTAVTDYTIFTRYFDALRRLKRVIHIFGDKAKGKADTGKEAYDKCAEELSQARIRGDIDKFSEAHRSLIPIIDASIALRVDFNRAGNYEMAELREHWCRELMYLKIELDAALPTQDLDLSVRGYNIADEGLRQWQTVGRKEEGDAKRKRKAKKEADREALEEFVKKRKLAAESGKSKNEPETQAEGEVDTDEESD